VVLWDESGATLVDTGAPGQVDELEAALRALGLGFGDVRRVVLTHQDPDHLGNAPEVVRRSGARVLAHPGDVPYIQGERRLLKMPPERVEGLVRGQPESRREEVARLFSPLPAVRVDETLADVHTPGHTPGHVSLYLEAHRLLIAADAVRVEDGALVGPNPVNTPDMPLALQSVAKLAALPAEHVLCHHGGLWGPGAAARLAEIARG
jgi:glyoxylase-like metal-dependent hydrolase (beta-lactamase superfamily II)